MAKQNSVARWVGQQAQEAPRYGNPFIPPSTMASSHHSPHASPRSTSPNQQFRRHQDYRDRGYESAHSRPPTRSRTAHEPRSRHHHSHSAVHPLQQTAGYSTTSLDLSYMNSQSHPNSRSSSRHHSRPAHSRTQSYAKNQSFSSSQLHLRSHGPHDTVRMADLAGTGYKSAPGQPVVMHAGKETYVVMPGHRRGVEFRVSVSHLQETIAHH